MAALATARQSAMSQSVQRRTRVPFIDGKNKSNGRMRRNQPRRYDPPRRVIISFQILALQRKSYCPLAAALPPDVRRGSATPTILVFSWALPLVRALPANFKAKGR